MSRDMGRRGNEEREEVRGELGRGAAEGKVWGKKQIGTFLPSSTHI